MQQVRVVLALLVVYLSVFPEQGKAENLRMRDTFVVQAICAHSDEVAVTAGEWYARRAWWPGARETATGLVKVSLAVNCAAVDSGFYDFFENLAWGLGDKLADAVNHAIDKLHLR